MTFLDELRATANAARAIPTDMGLRPYVVVIRIETYNDASQLGAPTITDLTLTPRPKVREESSGRELKVGPITPEHTGGGYTVAQLNPVADLPANRRVRYLVTGPNGTREYVLYDITSDRGYQTTMRLRSVEHDGPR